MIIACFVRCDASRLGRTAFIFTTSPWTSGWWIGERRHRLNKIMYTFNYIKLTLKIAYIITNYIPRLFVALMELHIPHFIYGAPTVAHGGGAEVVPPTWFANNTYTSYGPCSEHRKLYWSTEQAVRGWRPAFGGRWCALWFQLDRGLLSCLDTRTEARSFFVHLSACILGFWVWLALNSVQSSYSTQPSRRPWSCRPHMFIRCSRS